VKAVLLVFAVAIAASGSASAEPDKKPAAVAATGTIAGSVAFAGTPPDRAPLVRDSDPVCDATKKTAEDVVVTGGKLRDVLVRLPLGSAGSHAAPAEPAVVTQRECMYTPRVIGLVEGQKLVFRNGDATYHNIRAALGKRTVFNLGQPAQSPELVRADVGKAGEVVELHCDVHPWMLSFAVISDHPYFAVTGPHGSFRIEGVPVGSYVLEAWHPTLGLQKAKVTVKKGKTAKARFTFRQ
jgi:ER membrane protein complex subunit 7-like protein